MPVGFWLEGPTMEDLRNAEQIAAGMPYRGRVRVYSLGDRNQTPRAITAN